jgi:hypothetical protein
LNDLSNDLMARDDRKTGLNSPLDLIQLRMTHAAHGNLDQYLV